MIVISSRLPTKNLLIYKSLSRLIQGFFYKYLPPVEHEGFRHSKSGKVFKRMNFNFTLKDDILTICYRSFISEYEEKIALAVLKEGLKLGEIHLCDTNVSFIDHKVEANNVLLKGYVACAIRSLLGHKIYLEPQDSRHLEMMKKNILEKYETFYEKEYEEEFDITLKWQNFKEHKRFYYGNNQSPIKSFLASWSVNASSEIINMMLECGVGTGCMSAGCGVLDAVEHNSQNL